jgi:hypothetical protein
MFDTRRFSLAFLVACLLAALFQPASAADPVEMAVQKAVQWLHTQQLEDGGFGAPNSKMSSAAITSDVVYALALAGEDVDGAEWTKGGVSALDALAKLAPAYIAGDAGQAGKVARAAAAGGANPRSFGGMDVLAVIEQAYDPATGKYHPNFLFRHALAIEGLRASGEPVPAKAYAALAAGQLADGGWAWVFPSASATPTADADTTGRALQTLAAASQGACNPDFIAGAAYLARTQRGDAAWADLPTKNVSNSNSTALAVGGLRAIGRNPEASPYVKGGRNALQALLAYQEPGGAFSYIAEAGKEELRITATTDALVALLQSEGAASACPSVYLPVFLAR